APGTTVLTLASNERGRVLRVGLPDRDALRMTQGDAATAQFDAVPGKTFRGKVTLLGRSADVRTGTYVAEVALDDATALPAGLVGRVTLKPKAAAIATLIPIDALVEANADSAVIYTASTDKTPIAERHAVHILFVSGDRVAVQTDASASALERVVTRGAQYLTADMPVHIVSADGVDVKQANVASKAASIAKVKP
ncbi:MAG: HlyD family efflux transporter periplasmic adaptor subunit, partial [Gemmatimonadaceae bacterium]